MKWMVLAGLGLLALPALGNDIPAVVRHPQPEEMANAGLTMLRIAAEGVELGWLDSSNDETAYVVQRSTNGGPWMHVAVLPPNSTSAAPSAVLRPGAGYRYRIVAMNGDGPGRHLVSAVANVGIAP